MISETNEILFLANSLDDIESARVAAGNRVAALKDFGMGDDTPVMATAVAHHDALKQLEAGLVKTLQKAMRVHPLGSFVMSMKGVGEKQAARLLAVVGDPYWHPLFDRPRTVSQLWAYCGYSVVPVSHERVDTQRLHADGAYSSDTGQGGRETQHSPAGVAQRRTKGVKSNWSSEGRKRAWLIAASCIKQMDSPYRKVYDDAKAKHVDATHVASCINTVRLSAKQAAGKSKGASTNGCGTRAHPEWGEPGSPLRDGHKHARAMRAVAKEILKDLWLASRAWHEQNAAPTMWATITMHESSEPPLLDIDHPVPDTHSRGVDVHPLSDDHSGSVTHVSRVAAQPLATDQFGRVTHSTNVGGELLQAAAP